MPSTSAPAIATNIFTSPNEAYAQIRERPTVLLPVVILLLGYTAISFLYMHEVDLPWFMEMQLQASQAEITDEQREQMATAMANASPNVYGAIGAVSSSAFVFAWMFVVSLYYTGVSFVTNDGVKLKQWFALICWCTLPVALGLLAQIVHLLATDARFMLQDEINPLSFGNLFSIDYEGATLTQRILLSIDPTALWALVLMVLGYQAWAKASLVKSTAIVLGPLAVVVAIATLVSLL
jgi:hypothetical protein